VNYSFSQYEATLAIAGGQSDAENGGQSDAECSGYSGLENSDQSAAENGGQFRRILQLMKRSVFIRIRLQTGCIFISLSRLTATLTYMIYQEERLKNTSLMIPPLILK
jgi:hypothetical protein